MPKKVWIDAGHGGRASGAVSGSRMEKNDTLTFALELNRQFKAQGFATVLTRSTDKNVTLNARTSLERRAKCDLAISCHRNAATSPTANGLEVWLHSSAPKSYIAWASDMAQGIAKTGMALRAGQGTAGVYKGYRDSPKANYYANSGTNSPSCMLELGFMGSDKDNALFDDKYKEMCAGVVKASCRFLGVT